MSGMTDIVLHWDDLISPERLAIPKKSTPVAYCNSISCIDNPEPKSSGIIKDVSRFAVDCPECGCVLFWMIPSVGHTRSNKTTSKKQSRFSRRDYK